MLLETFDSPVESCPRLAFNKGPAQHWALMLTSIADVRAQGATVARLAQPIDLFFLALTM